MDSLEKLRQAIAQVFRSWEEYPNPDISKFRIVGVMDTIKDRYALTHIDFDNDRFRSHLLAQLEIRDGKIWILTDNTEDGIANELVAEGVAKGQIVLGYFSVGHRREIEEFAVA